MHTFFSYCMICNCARISTIFNCYTIPDTRASGVIQLCMMHGHAGKFWEHKSKA